MNVKITKRSKLVAQVRDVAFDEDASPDKQVADIRKLLLADLVARAEASVSPGSSSGNGGSKPGKGAVGHDGDQPVPGNVGSLNDDGGDLGDGDGDSDDLSVGNESDPKTKGKKKVPDTTDGHKLDSSHGLGLDAGANGKGTPSVGGNSGDGDNPAIGSGGAQVGKGSKNLSQNSKDTSDHEGRDGQPDASTDPEGDGDATRYLRAIARKRREQLDAEALGK